MKKWKCRYKDNNGNCTYTELGGKCDDIPCCYMKQLIIENEKLKNSYNEVSNNSEILHENNCLRISNAKLSEDLEQTETSMRAWRNECFKYKQVLEEIKKYAEERCRQKVLDKIDEVLR